MTAIPEFQVFECTNPQCHLRFPSNLSIKNLEICPLCGSSLIKSGPHYSNFSKQDHHTEKKRVPVYVLLDNLRSTLNVGSIFRTADGAGIAHIYCCGTTPTPEHPKIFKTGLGAESFIPWSYHRNALDLIDSLSKDTLLFSFESTEKSMSIFDLPFDEEEAKPILLIFGNEVSGVDPAILQRSDKVVELPMIGTKTSINVAVAAGIAMYTFLKKYPV